MDSIRVKNLRSLKDTGNIELKKLNLFVGNNSSGKSTLLRVFPLFKQSIQKKINGPVLWGGGDEYVDFGSFAESVNYGAQDDIRFIFDMYVYDDKYNYKRGQKTSLEIAIRGNDKNGLDYISELHYDYLGHRIVIEFTDEKKAAFIKVDGDVTDIRQTNGMKPDTWHLGTDFLFGASVQSVNWMARIKAAECLDIKMEDPLISLNIDIVLLDNCMKSIFIRDILGEKLPEGSLSSVTAIIETAEKMGKLEEAKKWVLIFFALNFISSISDYVYSFFAKVYYITPIRASAERYYKLRNYSVDEVDCRGKNLPIFLNSLSISDFEKFQAWTLENMGFKITTVTSEGHVSLKVEKAGQLKPVNLSDAGFGYSQMLPIVTQLWYLIYRKENEGILFMPPINAPITIAIEQPELHLHPGLQAKLADIIVKIAKENNVRFIIETHSETIINRIGILIDKHWISNNDVGVYIFEKKLGEDDTTVNKGSYDEEGYLQNWPIGFFEPEEV